MSAALKSISGRVRPEREAEAVDLTIGRDTAQRAQEVRHTLHILAEISMRENETRAFTAAYLEKNTSFRVTGRGAWLYAFRGRDIPGEEGPIAFAANLDALPIPETIPLAWASKTPGVSHKCGHDGHMASLLGLALALEGVKLPRDVYLILEPGEEIGAGGEMCASLIGEKGIREVYAFHNRPGYPEGTVVCRGGQIQCASMGLRLCFEGKTSHASEPEAGRNPSLAMACLVTEMDGYIRRPHQGGVWCTVVGMKAGEGDFGINPGHGEVCLTLRAEGQEEMDALRTHAEETARALAARCGLSLSAQESDVFPETRNHPAAAEKVLRCAANLGFPVLRPERPWRASEDFGYYTRECPGAMFYIGCGENWPDLHTAAYDFNDALLPAAIRMFAALI